MNREGLYEPDDDDDDDGIGVDLEELRRACTVSEAKGMLLDSEDEEDDDLEMIRSKKNQSPSSVDMGLCGTAPSVPSDLESEREDFDMLRIFKSQSELLSDDDEEDETLGAIRRRFSVYENPDSETSSEPPEILKAFQSSLVPAAQAFVDAIRINRSYQSFLQRKLGEIGSTIAQNEKHMKNVKIIKDFQASCKRITKQELSRQTDPRVKLITTAKSRPASDSSKMGPPENAYVADYRLALEKYPVSVHRRNWTTKEKDNLAKGIKQQVQNILMLQAVERSGDLEGSTDDIKPILEAIENYEITPVIIRQFLPLVNWDQLDIQNRSAAECEARWVSTDDPLINNELWTAAEDEKLLRTIGKKGLTDWLDIAVTLGTNRTPFQCLARYQRSLNASILRKEWTAEEDDQLRAAVDLFGEKNWQSVANVLHGRTGRQCSNRWSKSLQPSIKRKQKWTSEEDKRLKVAVTLFGAKNWHKIAKFIPGRTSSKCLERWGNSLDPKIKSGRWTKEEDAKLREAVGKHGYRWCKVAAYMSCRTDSQCLRRWKRLYPQLADRESERPDLAD